MEQRNKAARDLVESVRNTVKRNIVLAVRNGSIHVDESTLTNVLSIIDSSFNEGFLTALNVFSREVK